ncbi:hypothetical protein CYMTET_4902 [Cymbomonas tetramitiformis]|uniref:Kinesin motor domain-containing protein n=1 Tax=Cymbomonas tetramitiformis TaxID=36881 RepID=A0AAE0H091_9CHLO|nr:hypothetical protein CYMTET_4902 [Cymbomonas tetramitiformis]
MPLACSAPRRPSAGGKGPGKKPEVPPKEAEPSAVPTQERAGGRRMSAPPAVPPSANSPGVQKSACVMQVERIKAKREERRLQADAAAKRKEDNKRYYGNDADAVEYMQMIEAERTLFQENPPPTRDHNPHAKVVVMVRKRPLNKKEEGSRAFDVITMFDRDTGRLVLHEPKTKVDMSKCVDNHHFAFDKIFAEHTANQEVYDHAVRPLVEQCISQEGCMATAFAYGQTGSGKTFTMAAVYTAAAHSILRSARQYGLRVGISFFEIYGVKCFDLLANRKPVNILEDAKGKVCLVGLVEHPVEGPDQVLQLVEHGTRCRSTGSTSANETSSRSHSVFQIVLKEPEGGQRSTRKLALIDLAGSERGADTANADRKTRNEGAEINKSLLALKECIRALSTGSSHVPFRGSKLTQVLRDAFVGERSRTVLLAHVAPASNSAEHSLNTLRYADRIKEMAPAGQGDALPGPNFPPSVDYELRDVHAEDGEGTLPLLPLAPNRPAGDAARRNNPMSPGGGAVGRARRAESDNGAASARGDGGGRAAPKGPPRLPGGGDRGGGGARAVNPSQAASQQAIDKLEETRKHVIREEEDIRALHAALLAEQKKLVAEEAALLQNGNMESYVETVEQILDMRAALDAQLRDHIATYKQLLLDEEMSTKQLADLVWA